MAMKGSIEIEGLEDGFIASALASEADVPSASGGFKRRCLAAMRSSLCGAPEPRRWTGLRRAVVVAAAVSVATWAAAVVVLRSCGGRAPAAGCVEDVAALGVVVPSVVASGASSVSNESVVNANPGATALWRTLNAGQAQMAWEWPERAVSARLTITGAGVTAERVYTKSDAFPVWNPPVPENFSEDDVYTAKLTFYNGEYGLGDQVACLVAEGIGFVRGVSGEGSRFALENAVKFRVAGR